MGLSRSSGLLLAILTASRAFAADVQRFEITQANPRLPVITAYLDIVDDAGQPVADLTASNFAAAVGPRSATVTGLQPFRSTKEGVAYAFLVDVSKSISPAQFSEMRTAIQTWIAGMKPPDRAAVCTFGDDYRLAADFTADKQKLLAALDGQAPHDLHTRLYEALDRAVELQERIDPDLPVRRVIVILSDGKDEGSALTPDDVLLKLRASRLPVYSIGLSHLPAIEKQRYLDVLHRFSSATGGVYEDAAAAGIPQLYAGIQESILRVFVAHIACPTCIADGNSYPLAITLTQGTRGIKAAPLDIVPLPAPVPPAPPLPLPWWKRLPLWAWMAAAAIVLAALGFVAFHRRQRAPEPATSKAGFISGNTADAGASEPEPDEAAEGMPLKLTVVAGRDAGISHELRLHYKAVIGRANDCEVAVPDPEVSNHHCELALIHGQVLVYDLGSTNSTYVNGVPIRGRHKLEPQDTILVGETELRVHFEGI